MSERPKTASVVVAVPLSPALLGYPWLRAEVRERLDAREGAYEPWVGSGESRWSFSVGSGAESTSICRRAVDR